METTEPKNLLLQHTSPYACKNCGAAVIVLKDEILRICDCKAPVVMTLTATCTGTGGVTNGKRVQWDC